MYSNMLQTNEITTSGQILCQTKFKIFSLNSYEKVSIKRVRELRIKIQNEARNLENDPPTPPCQQTGIHNPKEQKWHSYAIT